jgi:hypothetical protein
MHYCCSTLLSYMILFLAILSSLSVRQPDLGSLRPTLCRCRLSCYAQAYPLDEQSCAMSPATLHLEVVSSKNINTLRHHSAATILSLSCSLIAKSLSAHQPGSQDLGTKLGSLDLHCVQHQ